MTSEGLSSRQAGSRPIPWSYALNGSRQLTTLALMFFLAFLLGPAEFGVIALCNLLFLLLQSFLLQGTVSFLIHREELTREILDTCYWCAIGLSLLLAAASCVGLAPMLTWLTGDERTAMFVYALSATLPLQGLSAVQEAVLRRRQQFRTLTLRANLAVATSGGAAVASALVGAGAWSLVIQQLVLIGMGSLVLAVVSEYRPGGKTTRSAGQAFLSALVLTGSANVGSFITNRVEILVIGGAGGVEAAGLYRLAARIPESIVEITARPLQSVALPRLAGTQSETRAFDAEFLRTVRRASLATFPILAVLMPLSPIILRLLGDEWRAANGALIMLSATCAVYALTLFTGPALQAKGFFAASARLVWVSAAGTIVAFAAAAAAAGASWRASHLDVGQVVFLFASVRFALQTFVLVGISLHYLRHVSRVRACSLGLAVLPALGSGVAGALVTAIVVASLRNDLVALCLGAVAGLIAALGMLAVIYRSGLDPRRLIKEVARG